MNDRLERLLDAHVQHELARFQGRRLRKAVEEEVDAAFEWTREVRLKDLVTPEQVLGVIRRNVVDLPMSGGVTELAGEMSRKVLASRHNQDATLEDIFARKLFDDMVDKAVGLENVRTRLIHRAIHTSAYAAVISDVVFTLIQEFLQRESNFAQKVPGVSSLMRLGKLGKEAVQKTLPNLEATFERRIREFIQANLERALQHSERFLVEFLDQDRIVELADVVWDSIARVPLAEHFGTIDADDMEDFVVIGIEFWLHFRKTRYFEQIHTELVHAFFEKYGEKEVDVLLEDVGVSRQMVIREVMELLSPGIEKALASGYLERRIRARLSAFYGSKRAAAALV